jgi:hypothetical protein
VGRIAPVEFRRYRVLATVQEAFREGDGDIHVVIHDPHHDGEFDPAHTMIAEFPDTTCSPQRFSGAVVAMRNARKASRALVRRCTGYTGNFGSHRILHVKAYISGIGFWDVKHGNPQKGARTERSRAAPGAESHAREVRLKGPPRRRAAR